MQEAYNKVSTSFSVLKGPATYANSRRRTFDHVHILLLQKYMYSGSFLFSTYCDGAWLKTTTATRPLLHTPPDPNTFQCYVFVAYIAACLHILLSAPGRFIPSATSHQCTPLPGFLSVYNLISPSDAILAPHVVSWLVVLCGPSFASPPPPQLRDPLASNAAAFHWLQSLDRGLSVSFSTTYRKTSLSGLFLAKEEDGNGKPHY